MQFTFLYPANQRIDFNTDLLTSLPQSSTNGTNRNLLDFNLDTLDNTGNTKYNIIVVFIFQLHIIKYYRFNCIFII